MQVNEIGGRKATNRAGAAEYLDIPLTTVRMYSSPAQRKRRGWPEPIPRQLVPVDNERAEDWFYLDELDALRPTPGPPPPSVDDPDRLITLAEFAAIRGVTPAVAQNYVEESVHAWNDGRDGTLPVPDESKPAAHGFHYRWRHDRALAWESPARPRRSTGRPPGLRPTVDDLKAVLADQGDSASRLTAADVAVLLADRLGVPVSPRTAQRLRAAAAKADQNR